MGIFTGCSDRQNKSRQICRLHLHVHTCLLRILLLVVLRLYHAKVGGNINLKWFRFCSSFLARMAVPEIASMKF